LPGVFRTDAFTAHGLVRGHTELEQRVVNPHKTTFR
jgi:hypothetical protein